MKKILSMVLIVLLLVGCGNKNETVKVENKEEQKEAENEVIEDINKEDSEEITNAGIIVYYDVVKGEICNVDDTENYHIDNSKTGYNGINKTLDTQTSCLKFYAIDDSKTKLLLDHNTTDVIAWNKDSVLNEDGPTTVLNKLKQDTNSWNTKTPTNYNDPKYGKLDYNGYKARLITAEEIAKITKNTTWNTSGETFYFDTNSNTIEQDIHKKVSKYSWLFDYTKKCANYGCNVEDNSTYGYWTSSSINNKDFANHAWAVTESGSLSGSYNIMKNDYYGIRPVIEI